MMLSLAKINANNIWKKGNLEFKSIPFPVYKHMLDRGKFYIPPHLKINYLGENQTFLLDQGCSTMQ